MIACLFISVALSLLRVRVLGSRLFFLCWNASCLALSSLWFLIVRALINSSSPVAFDGFKSLARGGSAGRLELWGQWLSSMRSILDFVIGNGFNIPYQVLSSAESLPSNPHNLIVEITVKGGLVSLAVLIIFLVNYLYSFLEWSPRALVSLLFVVAPLALYSLIAAPFEWPSSLWLMGLALLSVCFYEESRWGSASFRRIHGQVASTSLSQLYILGIDFFLSIFSVRMLFLKQIELIPSLLLQ